MTHPPFGLSSQAFGIGIVVVWLTVIPTLSMVIGRKKRKRMLAATAASYQAQSLPGAVPFGDLIGDSQFRSAARLLGIIVGVVLGLGAIDIPFSMLTMQADLADSADRSMDIVEAISSGVIGLTVISYAVWRPTRAAQLCHVDRNLAVTLSRGGRDIPVDLRHYRFVRMHVGRARYGMTKPSMLVLDLDSPPGIFTLLSSMMVPRFDEERIVLFYNSWTTAEGAMIRANRMDDFFIDTCRRAGWAPRVRRGPGRASWDAGGI
jgi:hypothetical protein